MDALDSSKNIRMPQSFSDRADAIAQALMDQLPMKVTISQSDVFRQAIERGLTSLESELGIGGDSSKK